MKIQVMICACCRKTIGVNKINEAGTGMKIDHSNGLL